MIRNRSSGLGCLTRLAKLAAHATGEVLVVRFPALRYRVEENAALQRFHYFRFLASPEGGHHGQVHVTYAVQRQNQGLLGGRCAVGDNERPDDPLGEDGGLANGAGLRVELLQCRDVHRVGISAERVEIGTADGDFPVGVLDSLLAVDRSPHPHEGVVEPVQLSPRCRLFLLRAVLGLGAKNLPLRIPDLRERNDPVNVPLTSKTVCDPPPTDPPAQKPAHHLVCAVGQTRYERGVAEFDRGRCGALNEGVSGQEAEDPFHLGGER